MTIYETLTKVVL